jgi:hypothetical protein
MNHHMALCLLDPKVKEKRKLAEKKSETQGSGLDIAQNLKNLEVRRPDIFGSK